MGSRGTVVKAGSEAGWPACYPDSMAESDESTRPAEPDLSSVGSALFQDVLARFVEPHIAARMADGSLAEDTVIYRFQVLLPYEGETEVRFNEEVGGTTQAVATRAIEAGQEVTTDDIAGITGYTPRSEDAGTPHVTAFAHRNGWSIAFEFSYRHPVRHDFLALGRDFTTTAREALAADRVGVSLDAAFSAAELLAKAELLSCAPTIESALAARTHGSVREPYSLWARLDNTDRRFVTLLGRLQDLRGPARYLRGQLNLPDGEPQALIETLEEMLEHVERVAAGDPPRDEPHGFNVVAAPTSARANSCAPATSRFVLLRRRATTDHAKARGTRPTRRLRLRR